MKIFKEGDQIRFQLVRDTPFSREWMFNFSIQKDEYKGLKKHILEAFEKFDSENK